MATALKHAPISESYDVTVAERNGAPGAWNVEAIDGEGAIEQAIFLGPQAEDRARDYAAHRYQA